MHLYIVITKRRNVINFCCLRVKVLPETLTETDVWDFERKWLLSNVSDQQKKARQGHLTWLTELNDIVLSKYNETNMKIFVVDIDERKAERVTSNL